MLGMASLLCSVLLAFYSGLYWTFLDPLLVLSLIPTALFHGELFTALRSTTIDTTHASYSIHKQQNLNSISGLHVTDDES
ncbi:hypothetical protein QBC40DRAFT_104504 [Triangularia verruculosa]|uniref:Uncharacterized protein n=1 Tax=Triangularia verruculosa TaxID=2587418 RepID=A0AAN6XPP4_9PEZI|nr:hypothetical protein QBC40DRAFT_104504 [Triangularia verruculosa]